MDDQLFNNDFERFLQQQVKQHRMYPSDAVWKGIYGQLHGHKRWPGLYFVAILMVAALTVCTVLMDATPIVYPAAVAKATPDVNRLDPAHITGETIRHIGRKQSNDNTSDIPAEDMQDMQDQQISVVEQINAPVQLQSTITAETATEGYQASLPETSAGFITNYSTGNTALLEQQRRDVLQNIALINAFPSLETEAAEMQQQVVKNTLKKKRWQYQFYMTPSTSFRKIVDTKPQSTNNGGVSATNYTIAADQATQKHSPGMGIEFGLGAVYSVTDRLRLKASFQYNVRQYNIGAYAGNYIPATIAVVRGNTVETINTVARYRSVGVIGLTNEALLQNKYQQLSLPVGFEYAVLNSRRLGLNVGGTVQPTYTLNEDAYLLTSDYKSYADGKGMIRKWNVNTGLEATMSYKVGDFEWKLGPQLRYQHLSTYKDAYPIKEFLVDYGFKIGFTKTVR